MNTISQNSFAKILINKSQFFGYTYKIESEEEVKPIIQELRKKHKSAGHFAYAFKVAQINEDNIEYISRFDDDGEPSKTAGFPILGLIEQQELCNVVFVVARIFGGIKLGTAGLIKAYGDCAREVLANTIIIPYIPSKTIHKKTTIQNYSNIETFLKQQKLEYKTEFSEQINIEIRIPLENKKIEEEIEDLVRRWN